METESESIDNRVLHEATVRFKIVQWIGLNEENIIFCAV